MSNHESYQHGASGERSPVSNNDAQWQFEPPEHVVDASSEQPVAGLSAEQIKAGTDAFYEQSGLENPDQGPVEWLDPTRVEDAITNPNGKSPAELAAANKLWQERMSTAAAEQQARAEAFNKLPVKSRRGLGGSALRSLLGGRKRSKVADAPISYVAPPAAPKPGEPFHFS